MPEGDTVRRTANRLHAALAGARVERAELRWGERDASPMLGSTTTEVVSRGKHLLHRTDTGWTLHTHLRMEGQWRIAAPGSPESAGRSRDVRALVATEAWTALGLRLGVVELLRTADEDTVVGHLGPDVLDPAFDAVGIAATLRSDARPLAEALLDQRVVAGIGTFWASEGLFVERLFPWRPANDVPAEDLARVLERIHRLMTVAVGHAIQSSTGIRRLGQNAYVHARSGRPCRRCGTTVRVAMVGTAPRERTIFSCPACQGGLAPTDDGRPQRPLGSGPRSGARRY